jgi:hypothetical protein
MTARDAVVEGTSMTTNDPTFNVLPRRIGRFRHRRWAAIVVAALTGLTGGSIAAVAPVAVGPAAAAVPGLVAVDATLASSIDPVQSVTVSCPGNKKLISAGGYITGGVGAVTIDDIYPNPAENSVTVTGMETDPPFGVAWRPTAVATCADDVPGLEWVDARSPYNSVDKSVTATCPSGKKLVGVGATAEDAGGNVLITGITPKNGGPGVAADSVTVTAHEEAPFSDSWLVSAFAACADPLAGQEVVATATGHDSADPKAFSAGCDNGQVATGGSAAILASPAAIGNVLIDDLNPNNVGSGTAPTMTSATAYVEDSPAGATWTLKLYSLCADA